MPSFCGLHPIKVPTVSPDLSLQAAIAHLSEAEVDCLLVVVAGQLQGWLTAQDVVKLAAQERVGENCPLSLVMTQPPYILNPLEAEDLFLVLQYFQQYQINQLPVVAEGGELLGVVTAQGVVPLCINQIDRLEHLEQQADRFTLGRTEQEYLLQEIINSVSGVIYIYDLEEQRNIYCSDSIGGLLGYNPEEIQSMGQNLFLTIMHPEDLPSVVEMATARSSNSFPHDSPLVTEYRVRHADGSWRWWSSYDRTFRRHPDGRAKQTIGIAQDITDRKQLELELESSQHFLKQITNAFPGIIYVYDVTSQRVIYANSRIAETLGYAQEQGKYAGYGSLTQLIHPEDLPIVRSFAEQLELQPTAHVELRIKNSQGEWQWFLDQVVALRTNPDGSPQQILGVCIDIHDRKIAEATLEKINTDLEEIVAERTKEIRENNLRLLQEIEEKNQVEIALRKSEDRFKKIVANVPGMVYQFCQDNQGNYSFTYASEYSRKLYELAPAVMVRDANFIMALTHPEDLKQLYSSIDLSFRTLQPWYFLGRIITPSGKVKWVEAISRPERQINGDTIWDGIVLDVTERELAHIEIRKTLLEKEILLKEIHHRVKNNLQIITSLLSLQSQYISDSNIIKLFQESQDRIYSMALIHEQLYGAKDVSHVNISAYIEALISHLQQSYFLQKHIHLAIQAENIYFNIETAIPCGLIINELVTNALKYAFPIDRYYPHKQITVTFTRIDVQKFSLTISDNGVGIETYLDIENSETLGLSLVWMLTQQLEGEILIKNQQGTQFIIIFSELDYNQRV